MNQTQLLEKFQALPPDKQEEVLDFIDFLASRSPSSRKPKISDDEWTTAEFSQMAMSQAMRGMEDEPLLYSLDDLRERWQ
ncbi:DUF2281 domain-containing protein [Leptolyngbya sp. AN03gr2]|uniref:DUF2281 domain-containing protein n=1 Tax=unclassified Leptolyngbya TaxID=2650499 RepID=UPI003D3163CF